MINRDALLIEYEDLRQELQGISPKLSLYTEIQKRMNDILLKTHGEKMLPRKILGQKNKNGKTRYKSRFQQV